MEKKSKGGLTKGPSHAKGGIKMQIGADGTQIEVEGGEGIINNVVMDSIITHDFEGKKMTACQIASFLNQTDGNGVKFSCDVNDNPSFSEGIDREMEEAISKRNKGGEIKLDGGEGIINKYVMASKKKYSFNGKKMTPCDILSELNQSRSEGRKFNCSETEKTDMTPTDPSTGFAEGGEAKKKTKRGEYAKLAAKIKKEEGITYREAQKKASAIFKEMKAKGGVAGEVNGDFPGIGETVKAKDLNYEMLDYFNRMNISLSINTKSKNNIKGSVGTMFNDLVFNGGDIDKKDIVSVKIIESVVNEYKAKGGVAGEVKKEVKKITTPKAVTTDIAEEVAEAALFDKGGKAENVEHKSNVSNVDDIKASLLSRGILNEGGKLAKGSVVFPKDFMNYVKSDNVIQRSNGLYYNNETQYRKGFTLKELYKWTQKEDYEFAKGGDITPFEKTKQYFGQDLSLIEIYDEDKNRNWDDEAQSMIEYYQRQGKKAMVIHRGNLHALYSEKSSYAKGGNVGDKIRVSKTPYMTSFSTLYDKDLEIKDIKEFKFGLTGDKKFYVVNYDGEEYEIPEDMIQRGEMIRYKSDYYDQDSFDLTRRSADQAVKIIGKTANEYAELKGLDKEQIDNMNSDFDVHYRDGAEAYGEYGDFEDEYVQDAKRLFNKYIGKYGEDHVATFYWDKTYAKGGDVGLGSVVANKKNKTIGIVRDYFEKYGEAITDADGIVNISDLEPYNAKKHKDYNIASSTKDEIESAEMEYAKGGKLSKKVKSIKKEFVGVNNKLRGVKSDLEKASYKDDKAYNLSRMASDTAYTGTQYQDKLNKLEDDMIDEGYAKGGKTKKFPLAVQRRVDEINEMLPKVNESGDYASTYAGSTMESYIILDKPIQIKGKYVYISEEDSRWGKYGFEKRYNVNDREDINFSMNGREALMYDLSIIKRSFTKLLKSEGKLAKGGSLDIQGIRADKEDDVKRFMKNFPSNPTSWRDATDELRTMANSAREYYIALDLDGDKSKSPKFFTYTKQTTPSEFNKGHKKNVVTYMEKMSDGTFDAFYKEFNETFAKGGEVGWNWTEKEIRKGANTLAEALTIYEEVPFEVRDVEYEKGKRASFELFSAPYDLSLYYVKANGAMVNPNFTDPYGDGGEIGHIKDSKEKILKEYLSYLDDDYFNKGGEVDNPNELYFIIRHGNGEALVQISKDYGDSKYSERFLAGDKPYNFGNKTYQSYLSPSEIENYLANDYISATMVDEEIVEYYNESSKEEANKLIIMKFPEDYVDPGILTIVKGEEAYDFDTNTGKIEFYTKFNSYPDNLNKKDFLEDAYPVGEEDLTESDKKIILNFFKDKLNYGGEVYPNNEFAKGGQFYFDQFVLDTRKNKGSEPKIECQSCGWDWKVSEGGDDLYICHKCYTDNEPYAKGGNVSDFSNHLISKYDDLKTLFLSEDNSSISIDMIEVDSSSRKQGVGSEVMQEITDYADDNNKEIVLLPSVSDKYMGTTSRNRLIKFYKKFGFVENKGRNKDFRKRSGSMYRTPTDQNTDFAKGGETYEKQYERRVVKTTKKEHKDKGYDWRIKGKDRNEVTIKLYEKKPDFEEFSEQLQRVAGHQFGTRAKGGNIDWFKSEEGKGDPAITKRNKPNVNALEKYGAGEISYDDYLKISQKETPIKEIDVFYEPATYDEIYNALEKQNQKISTKQGKVPKQDVIDAPIEKGQAIGVRLDIPSYVRYNTWVVSIHDGHKQSGKPISYQAVVRIKDVTFGTVPSFAFLIAIGDVPKNTIGRMYGYYDPIEGETAEERSENTKKLVSEINKDKDWSQVGMNPFRHSYFYLRKNGMPVVSADEVVQIGGLVYAKNAKTVKPYDDEFKIDNSRVKEKYPGITHFNKGGQNDITDLAYTVAWDCHIGGNRPNIDVVKRDIKKLMSEENIGMHYLLTNCYDYFEKGGLI